MLLCYNNYVIINNALLLLLLLSSAISKNRKKYITKNNNRGQKHIEHFHMLCLIYKKGAFLVFKEKGLFEGFFI